MQHAAAFLYYFLLFPNSFFRERPISRVKFRPIESKRPDLKIYPRSEAVSSRQLCYFLTSIPDRTVTGAAIWRRSFVCGLSATLMVQVWDGGLTLASCPGVFSSGIRPRRIQVGRGLFIHFVKIPSLVSSADQALPVLSFLGSGRPLGDLSCINSIFRRKS
ncbi:hypothetical protein EVAR_98541_1 [Eumeta japonica]|uniref:Uncharacterized protein n=1 Tax=Eumeta variegata TaxID=151549 RepID=A0A4C1YH41_EUMVA|nr:hypothetical protein EVAR_98541_1 [Eumeta japonica]